MSERQASEETRNYGRSAAQLTGVLGLVGVLTYVFFALCSHSLGKTQYGEIVVLWSVVFLLSSTLFRPIEQLLSRTLAEQEQAGTEHRTALVAAAKIQAALCFLAIVGLLIARGADRGRPLRRRRAFYWSMIAALIGFGIAYYARGFLAGRRPVQLLRSAAPRRGRAAPDPDRDRRVRHRRRSGADRRRHRRRARSDAWSCCRWRSAAAGGRRGRPGRRRAGETGGRS